MSVKSLFMEADEGYGAVATRLLMLLAMIILAVFFLMPIVWSFANSFKPAAEALAHPVALFSKAFSLENYRRLENVGAGWYVYATNSVLIALGTIAFTVAVAVPRLTQQRVKVVVVPVAVLVEVGGAGFGTVGVDF